MFDNDTEATVPLTIVIMATLMVAAFLAILLLVSAL